MGRLPRVVVAVFALTLALWSQEEAPTFKSGVRSAFVWGDDLPEGAQSSTIRDPLTSHAIRKLAFQGVEVSSQVGFERIGHGRTGALLTFTSTVVNATQSTLSVRYGGTSVDGRHVSPLRVLPTLTGIKKGDGRNTDGDIVALGSMDCFRGGFLPSESSFFTRSPSESFDVRPRAALTVSSVIVDPSSYALRCSVEGCFPRATMRYYLNINSHDYVFVWPGRSAIYCGK